MMPFVFSDTLIFVHQTVGKFGEPRDGGRDESVRWLDGRVAPELFWYRSAMVPLRYYESVFTAVICDRVRVRVNS